ncbi:hypothetical protein ElyMa_005928500 [Elysia marginata]|uniref:REJ domain-containing protein n=1 Tax=Elysia marginata TaxID=1093978 RepID=A0AAV4G7Z0_9GAST|nr:hypothetical protein ElyMa_005928500 [Elysia marginata]
MFRMIQSRISIVLKSETAYLSTLTTELLYFRFSLTTSVSRYASVTADMVVAWSPGSGSSRRVAGGVGRAELAGIVEVAAAATAAAAALVVVVVVEVVVVEILAAIAALVVVVSSNSSGSSSSSNNSSSSSNSSKSNNSSSSRRRSSSSSSSNISTS